jgi:hypothetical protein
MIENRNTIVVSPPLDAEDWQIAFAPYLKHPFLALALAQHLSACKTKYKVTLQRPQPQ